MIIKTVFHLLLLGFIFSLNAPVFASDLTGRCGQNPSLSLQTGMLSLPSIDVAVDESGVIVPYQALLKYDFERQVFLLTDAAEDQQDCELQPSTGIPPSSDMRIANGACCGKVGGACISVCDNSAGCTGKGDCRLAISTSASSTGITQGECCGKVGGVCISTCEKSGGCTGSGDCSLRLSSGDSSSQTDGSIPTGACCAKVLGSCLSNCKKSGGCTGKSDCSLVLSQQPQTGNTGIAQGGCCATVNGVCLSKCNQGSGCTGQGDCSLVLSSASQSGTAIPPGGCCATVHGACVTECTNRAGCSGQGDCSLKLSAFPPPADAASVLLPQ